MSQHATFKSMRFIKFQNHDKNQVKKIEKELTKTKRQAHLSQQVV